MNKRALILEIYYSSKMGNCLHNTINEPQKAAIPKKGSRKSRPSRSPAAMREPYPSIEDVIMKENRRSKQSQI